jgi:hypothetical protein
VKHNGAQRADDPLARIDAIAAAALSGNSLALYHAYKKVLLAREQDHQAIASTLTLFVLDLSEASDRTAEISRPG